MVGTLHGHRMDIKVATAIQSRAASSDICMTYDLWVTRCTRYGFHDRYIIRSSTMLQSSAELSIRERNPGLTYTCQTYVLDFSLLVMTHIISWWCCRCSRLACEASKFLTSHLGIFFHLFLPAYLEARQDGSRVLPCPFPSAAFYAPFLLLVPSLRMH